MNSQQDTLFDTWQNEQKLKSYMEIKQKNWDLYGFNPEPGIEILVIASVGFCLDDNVISFTYGMEVKLLSLNKEKNEAIVKVREDPELYHNSGKTFRLGYYDIFPILYR